MDTVMAKAQKCAFLPGGKKEKCKKIMLSTTEIRENEFLA
jgi:hypothetical protein